MMRPDHEMVRTGVKRILLPNVQQDFFKKPLPEEGRVASMAEKKVCSEKPGLGKRMSRSMILMALVTAAFVLFMGEYLKLFTLERAEQMNARAGFRQIESYQKETGVSLNEAFQLIVSGGEVHWYALDGKRQVVIASKARQEVGETFRETGFSKTALPEAVFYARIHGKMQYCVAKEEKGYWLVRTVNGSFFVREMLRGLLYITLTALLMMVMQVRLVLRMTRRRVLEPLAGMNACMERMEDGNYSVRIGEQSSKELDDLAAHMNHLLGSVECHMKTLRFNNHHDLLTRVWNRNALEERTTELGKRRVSCGVVYADLNGLKRINDLLGHGEGDRALTDLADSLSRVFGKKNVYRAGGDEFVVLDELMTEEDLSQKCEAFRAVAESIHLSVALGGVFCPDSRALEECMKRADAFMYEDKRQYYASHREEDQRGLPPAAPKVPAAAGPGVLRPDEKGMELRQSLEEYILTRFEGAMDKGELQLYYQPVVRNEDDQPYCEEALIRWFTKDRGMISPAQILPVLRKYHLGSKLDAFVLRQVAQDRRREVQEGMGFLPVSVNLTGDEFSGREAADRILEICAECGILPDQIRFEVSGASLPNCGSGLPEGLNRLREAGFRVWLDDFGRGSEAFLLLEIFDFDAVKLDMGMFRHNPGEKSTEILKSLLRLADVLGTETIAKGVETETERTMQREAGCRNYQGYVFRKPMSVGEMIEKRKWEEKNE